MAACTCIALFAFAFLAAPHSCQWGHEAYLWAGAGTLLMLGGMPFVAGVSSSLRRRSGLALGLLVLGSAVWLAGFVVANFRIVCKLF